MLGNVFTVSCEQPDQLSRRGRPQTRDIEEIKNLPINLLAFLIFFSLGVTPPI